MPNFGDDSLVFMMRVSDEKAAADVQAAFLRLRGQVGAINIPVNAEAGGAAAGRAAAEGQAAVNSQLADELAFRKADLEIMVAERKLLDEILMSQQLGIDVSRQRAVLEEQFQVAGEFTLKDLKQQVSARVTDLRLAQEQLAAQEQLIRAGATSNFASDRLKMAVGETELKQLQLVLAQQERGLEIEIVKARAAGFEVSSAETVLGQRRVISAEMLAKDAREVTAARLVELKTAKEALVLELQREAAVKRTAAVGDPLGKVLGGVRGLPLRNFSDLADSFTTTEALSARMISLFGGQIGTLLLYGAALQGVSTVMRHLIGDQAALQAATQKLATVLDSETGKETSDLLALENQARAWALAHSQGAVQVEEAMYDLAAAGLRATEVMKAFPAVGLLAQGGFVELKDTAELIATSMQTFAQEGLSAVQMANTLQATAANTATTVSELGGAVKYAAASAVTAGVSFDELNALLGTLASLGLRGSIAGTSLNQVFVQMAKNKDKLREMGIEIEDASGNMRPFLSLLDEFKQKFGTVISAGEQKLLVELFDVRGARAMERLIQDMTILPATLQKIKEGNTEVFRASEEGANTLGESFKVLGQQLSNLAISINRDLGLGWNLQRLLDTLTNRQGVRIAENINAGSQGIIFELDRINEAFQTNSEASREWTRRLLLEADRVEGEAGAKLRALRKDVLIQDPQALNEPFLLATGWDKVKQAIQLDQATASLIKLKEEMLVSVLAIESMTKGAEQFRRTFGAEAFGAIDPKVLESATTLQENFEIVRSNALRAWEAMLKTSDPKIAEDLWQQSFALESIALKLQQDADAAAKLKEKQEQAALIGSRIALEQAQLEALRAQPRLDFSAQRQAAGLELDIARKVLEDEEAQRKLTLDKEEASAERRYNVVLEFDAKRLAAARRFTGKMREIDLAELQANYDQAARIRELRKQILLARTDVGDQPQVEALFSTKDFEAQFALLRKQFEQGKINALQYLNLLEKTALEQELNDQKQVDSARKRVQQISELESAGAVRSAQMLLLKANTADNFREQERVAAEELYANLKQNDLQYFNDKTLHYLADQKAWDAYERELTRITIDEAKFRKQAHLEEIHALGGALSSTSQLIEKLSNASTAKLIGDLGRVTDAAGNVVDTLGKMAAGAISGPAGWLGIAGTVIGTIASILPGKSETDRQVAQLADEFRHQEGKNVSADFGKATVYNVRVEINPDFSFLGSPTPAQQRQVAELIADDVAEVFGELGILDSGGR